MDTDHEADMGSEEAKGSEGSRWKSPEEGVETSPCLDRCQCSRNWESIMEESEGLAFDNPRSGSDTTVMRADSPSVPQFSPRDKLVESPPTRLRGSAPHSPRLSMEAGGMPPLMPTVATAASGADTVEVHVPQSKLDNM